MQILEVTFDVCGEWDIKSDWLMEFMKDYSLHHSGVVTIGTEPTRTMSWLVPDEDVTPVRSVINALTWDNLKAFSYDFV